VELRFAAFLEDYQGRADPYCDVAGFGRSNGSVHGVVCQFRRSERATQLEQAHLVSRSKYTFGIRCNRHYGVIE
jgi:hypothetical protein